jgi:hypothetical protein
VEGFREFWGYVPNYITLYQLRLVQDDIFNKFNDIGMFYGDAFLWERGVPEETHVAQLCGEIALQITSKDAGAS